MSSRGVTAPGITGKRLVVFLMDAVFAVALARTFSVMEMALLGFAATTTVALISLYVDALQQNMFAPFDADYRFHGRDDGELSGDEPGGVHAVRVDAGAASGRRWMKWFAPLIGLELALLYLTRSRLGAMICIVLLSRDGDAAGAGTG